MLTTSVPISFNYGYPAFRCISRPDRGLLAGAGRLGVAVSEPQLAPKTAASLAGCCLFSSIALNRSA